MNTRTGIIAGLIMIVASLLVSAQTSTAAQNEKEAIEAISNHFESVPTMSGEFIQFGPNGEQTGGKFFIKRPGKIRFNYENPSPIMVVSNGRTLAVNNKKLKTWNYYPLDKTPLSLLLSKQIQISDESIRSVEAREDITTVVMGNKKIFGDSEITLLFDPQSQDLRQWTIKDAQGKETSVMIFNVQKNVDFPGNFFYVKPASDGKDRNSQK
ncbi:MAG: outer membrane lipoprotein carrier protein LolA [Pseudomonadota bacterium]